VEPKKPVEFTCVGSATQDVFVRSDAAKILSVSDLRSEERLLCFDYGRKIDVEHIEFTTGGGATNTAVSFARLGARAAFVGKIGTDRIGRLVIEELEEHGVDVSGHLESPDEATGYSVILTSHEGDRTVLTHRGASTEMTPDELDLSFVDRTGWLYVTSLAGRSAELLGPLADAAGRAGVRVAWNPGSTQLKAGLEAMKEFLACTEVLLLNKEEASRLTGREPVKDVIIEARCDLCEKCIEVCPTTVYARDHDRIVAASPGRCIRCGKCLPACPPKAIVMEPWTFNVAPAFKTLCGLGPKLVVITDGENGVQACDGETLHILPPCDVQVASTLGAGDAFGSAFTFEYARSGDVGRALALGTENAGSVVQEVGAKNGLLDAKQAEAALKRRDPSRLRTVPLDVVLEASEAPAGKGGDR
jgi:sugar/nucleoside kinase (ribokinase family)